MAKKKVPAKDIAGKQPALLDVIEKPWGHEVILARNDLYVVKQLFVKAGERLSKQFHNQKEEHLTLISGKGFISIEDEAARAVVRMRPMDPFHVSPGTVYRISAGDEDALFVEVSTPELDDVVRLEDDYGRQDDIKDIQSDIPELDNPDFED